MPCRRYRQFFAIALLSLIATADGWRPSLLADEAAADRGHAQTQAPGAGQKEPPGIRLQVRVLDTAGHPVPNAVARIIVMGDEQKFETATVSFDGAAELAVGQDGRLLTPALELDKPYALQIDAPGMLSGLSRWSRSAKRGTVQLPAVVLRRLLTVTGSVATGDNEPIAGATVIQSGDGPGRTQALTDSQGRFEIAGVPEGVAFLFAEKEGYAFHGQRVAAGTGPVRIGLESTTDARRRNLNTPTAPDLGLIRAQRLDLAYEVLKPRLQARLTQRPPQGDFWLMRELARANLPAALIYFDALVSAGVSPSDRDQQLEELADAIVVDDASEALALAQRISDPATRSSVLYNLRTELKLYAPRVANDGPAPDDRLAAETIFAARATGDPSLRVATLSRVAADLAAQGKPAGAAVLLAEAQTALEGLDPDVHKWYFDQIATSRVLIDLDTAGAQLAAIPKDDSFWRVFAKMQMGRREPRAAEALLASIDPAALFRDERAERPQRAPLYCTSCNVLTQICIQMAEGDANCAERAADRLFAALEGAAAPAASAPPSALRGDRAKTADLISDVEVQILKGVTLARMAERVVARDPSPARRWLEQAVRALAAPHGSKFRDGWFHVPAAAMASLVPLAEQIDPTLAHELFWRSLALRVGRSPGDGPQQRAQDSSTATLARMLGRYDLDVARQLLAPVLQNNRGDFLPWSPGEYVQIRIDGAALLATAQELARTPFDESASSRERQRLHVASRLCHVQDQMERDQPDYLSFELELIREQIGLNFYHPRMDD